MEASTVPESQQAAPPPRLRETYENEVVGKLESKFGYSSRMQVPRTYISKIENGKAIPTLGSLERLADALEVEISQLVRDGRSRREEEIAEIFADPFLAELAQYLPRLEPLQRSLLLNHARDRAREAMREMSLGKRRTA